MFNVKHACVERSAPIGTAGSSVALRTVFCHAVSAFGSFCGICVVFDIIYVYSRIGDCQKEGYGGKTTMHLDLLLIKRYFHQCNDNAVYRRLPAKELCKVPAAGIGQECSAEQCGWNTKGLQKHV